MPRVALACAGAALSGLVLTGCQSAPPAPAPTPTFTCTPEAGGDSFPCSQFQHDEMVAKDALYAEAEAVYRRFLAEDVRIMRAGGVSEPSDEIRATTAREFLSDVTAFYRGLRNDNARFRGGDFRLVELSRKAGISKGASLVTLESCVDARTAEIVKGGRSLRRGGVARDTFYFGRDAGRLKIIGADGHEVDSCES